MSGWQIGFIILCSGVTATLLVLSFFVLAKIGKVIDRVGGVVEEAQTSLHRATDEALVPISGEAVTTMKHVNSELEKVDAITANVATVTSNVTALTSVVSATIGGPAVKVAAFSYGVRQALKARHENDVEKRVRAELRRERSRRGRKES